jgi:cytochrome P450
MGLDPLCPPPPRAPYFDSRRDAWVLSRYRDVAAAFRDPDLWNVGPKGQDSSPNRDARGILLVRGEIQDALSPMRLAAWRSRMEGRAHRILDELPRGHAIDLLHDFTMQLCLDLAMRITGACETDRVLLAALAAQVFALVADPDGEQQRIVSEAATAEIERRLATAAIPQAEPAFVGVSQALPRLLANGWVALLRHPREFERLRANPDLMSNAVEELLRYAGIVPMVCRRARAGVEISGTRIAAGEKADLMIASANRDPEQFPDPGRLDIGREPAGQLTLGIGRNSCVGVVVIRMISSVTTGVLLERYSSIDLAEEVQWSIGSGFACPVSVRVLAA